MANLVKEGERHPALGPLCGRCGGPAEVDGHYLLCGAFAERRRLWASGWASVDAFGLPPEAATGWPEVRQGPAPRVLMGSFGPELIEPWEGPWVRHPSRRSGAYRRLAALFVRVGGSPVDSVLLGSSAEIVRARGRKVNRWLSPRVAIDTTACGRPHQVVIRRGRALAVNHSESESELPDESIQRFSSPLPCDELVRRWEAGDVGRTLGDLTASPVARYEQVDSDPALQGAAEVLRRACLARARCNLIERREPDRWLVLDAELARPDRPALLFPSTRPISLALVSAPPRWPWTREPLR